MTAFAKVLRPVEITDAMFTACAVAEPDASAGEVVWDAATNYAIGARVVRPALHKIFTATASGVDAGLPENTPLRWFDNDEPTNKWAAFDAYNSTAIKKTGTLTMTVKPGIITDMAFYGLVGDSLRVVCKDATSLSVYYDKSFGLSDYLSGDLMWEFYFGTPQQQDRLDITGLVPTDAQVEITLTPSPTTGDAQIAIFALGSFEPIGVPLQGFKAQLVDYSRIKFDDDGKVRIKKGLGAKNLNGECINLSAASAQSVVEVFERLLGTPCAWVMSSDNRFQYLSAFGLGSADFTSSGPNYASLSLTVRGLT